MASEITLATCMTLLAIIGWTANILGLPGNWLVVSAAAFAWWWYSDGERLHVGLTALVAIVVVAALGELLEFMAGALGASRLGGSRRGTLLAIVGAIAGAITGLFFGALIPIPLLGPLIVSVLLGASGAFAGAVSGERWAGKDWGTSLQIGSAAFWGRLLGTVGKSVCGTAAAGLLIMASWLAWL